MTSTDRNRDPSCSIQPSDHGPLLVKGPVTLVDQDGNEIVVTSKNVALCRCGASANKPFCDRSHARVGFRSAIRENPAAAGQHSAG
ncbi:MAG TPA: CDGSH iron-sulfur domain-containing protein [Actinomycetota bacterium]|nr:CDGSH iron-sulfur domain-containing protein [Actinomycetota bacterium]